MFCFIKWVREAITSDSLSSSQNTNFPLSIWHNFTRIVFALIPSSSSLLNSFQKGFALIIPPKLCIKVTDEFHVAKSNV